MSSKQTRVTLRIDLPNGTRLGPGKIALLSGIFEHGSIRKAGEAIGMSYRRAWLLGDEINRMFTEVSIATRHGGKSGGGAELTAFGQRLLDTARRMEAASADAIAADLRFLERNQAPAADESGSGRGARAATKRPDVD
ncbi:winged helix-turn-helix domain-containing protein [Rhizobium halophytocola]|uniref:Molybdate transport system regulatory protein n=1 Tax=Rhizobium halophytocola TaxID=735519 RepID=A0ABS4DXM4_9HYPH|nr:transcriptional regulator [Rhizobium halophytocola]MBP1850369.1 molybdate transport system regulatory protein [Rhizobium halophytocola]